MKSLFSAAVLLHLGRASERPRKSDKRRKGQRLFLVGMQPFATTLFGVLFPLPTPQGRRVQQLKTRPECWIRGLHEASTQGTEATSADLFRKEYLGMQRSPKAMLLRPTNVDLPERDRHLPTMESAGRRSIPVRLSRARHPHHSHRSTHAPNHPSPSTHACAHARATMSMLERPPSTHAASGLAGGGPSIEISNEPGHRCPTTFPVE